MSNLINRCLDLDEWKDSWHNDLKSLEDFEKAQESLEAKIKCREEEIQMLNTGLEEVYAEIAKARYYESTEK